MERTTGGCAAASTKAPGGNEEGAGPKRLREPDKAAEITEKCRFLSDHIRRCGRLWTLTNSLLHHYNFSVLQGARDSRSDVESRRPQARDLQVAVSALALKQA